MFCCQMRIRGLTSYGMYRQPESTDKLFFLKFIRQMQILTSFVTLLANTTALLGLHMEDVIAHLTLSTVTALSSLSF